MPTTLVLRLTGRRYPWGLHADTEDLPPSPWRLLRALHAVWRTRAPELDERTVHGLLARLAEPPTFHLPRFTASHRFAVLGVHWPFELPAVQRSALERLAGSIPYFGRADLPCSGSVATDWEPDAHQTWVPVDVVESVAEAAPVTSVLAAELPLRLDALLDRPGDVRKGELLFPSGTHLLAYQSVKPASQRRCARRAGPATAVRFTVQQAELPPQTDSLVYTDLLRQGALSKLGGLRQERVYTQLGGRTAGGDVMEGHGHAHYLPLLDNRRLAGLVVWVPDGLPDDELTALTSVDRLYSKVNPDWRLVIRAAAIGTPAEVAPELTAPLPAAGWRSVTPFTPPRYPKGNAEWRDYLRTEVDRELENRGLPPVRDLTVHSEKWQEWRRYRPTARTRHDLRQGQSTRASAFVRIELAKPLAGPLALGHLSHFGLGLFVPEPEGPLFT